MNQTIQKRANSSALFFHYNPVVFFWTKVLLGIVLGYAVCLVLVISWLGIQGFALIKTIRHSTLVQTLQQLENMRVPAKAWQALAPYACPTMCEQFVALTAQSRVLKEVLGSGKKYVYIWLQNDLEVRPTGGFLGSYALLTIENGAIADWKIEDIYVPDGQLRGYVEAPWALQTYMFQTGGWKLRDANWDPQFPAAVESVQWFFEQAGWPKADIVIATNFAFVQRLWEVIGTVQAPDLGKVGAAQLYPLVQRVSEENFFPGATNKTDILGALGRSLVRSLLEMTHEQEWQAFNVIAQSLERKDLLLWAEDDRLQKAWQQQNWSGVLYHTPNHQDQHMTDYLSLNEANIGINKTNCCLERQVVYSVYLSPGQPQVSKLTISYKNNNPSVPDPPRSYGGGYLTYLRVFRDLDWMLTNAESDLPAASTSAVLTMDNPHLNLREHAAILRVEGGQQRTYEWQFERPSQVDLQKSFSYNLELQRQPGSRTDQFRLQLFYPPTMRLKKASVSGVSSADSWTSVIDLNKDMSIQLDLEKK